MQIVLLMEQREWWKFKRYTKTLWWIYGLSGVSAAGILRENRALMVLALLWICSAFGLDRFRYLAQKKMVTLPKKLLPLLLHSYTNDLRTNTEPNTYIVQMGLNSIPLNKFVPTRKSIGFDTIFCCWLRRGSPHISDSLGILLRYFSHPKLEAWEGCTGKKSICR